MLDIIINNRNVSMWYYNHGTLLIIRQISLYIGVNGKIAKYRSYTLYIQKFYVFVSQS